jgi:hypothetical protein
MMYTAASGDLQKYPAGVSWNWVLTYTYPPPTTYSCQRTLVDYANAANPPSVQITLTQ